MDQSNFVIVVLLLWLLEKGEVNMGEEKEEARQSALGNKIL